MTRLRRALAALCCAAAALAAAPLRAADIPDLGPVEAKPVPRELPPLPDFEARRKRIWGDRVYTQAEWEADRQWETGEP